MFHGQLVCDGCGFAGPEFMWMYHRDWGLGALVQDQKSLELRVVEVPDDDVFYLGKGRPTQEMERVIDAHVEAVVAGQLRPGERHVLPTEFAWHGENDGGMTEILCPRCRGKLRWRGTGIS